MTATGLFNRLKKVRLHVIKSGDEKTWDMLFQFEQDLRKFLEDEEAI
jgi:hypothetical protein